MVFVKKYLIFGLTLFVGCSLVIAEEAISSNFVNALKTCSTSYSESGSFTTEGMNVTSTKKILGWENDRCVYQETVNFSGMNTCLTCKLAKSQIDELVSVMQAYEVVQKYSNEDIDTSKLSAVQDNPVVKVWNKYLQDSSTCTMKQVQ